jgi:hypothetical protein
LSSTSALSSSFCSTSGPFPPLLSYSSCRCRDNEENQSVGWLGILRGVEARRVKVLLLGPHMPCWILHIMGWLHFGYWDLEKLFLSIEPSTIWGHLAHLIMH